MTRRVRALWLPAVTVTVAAEATLYLVPVCGTAWLLVSFVLAPGVALALGLLAAAAWRWRAKAAGLTSHPLVAQS